MSDVAQTSSEILFKRICIALMAQRREKKLAYMAAWRAKNPGAKKKWDETNKDRVEAYSTKYASTPEVRLRRKATMRAWKVKNREHVKSLKKIWELSNPKKHSEIQSRANIKWANSNPHVQLKKRISGCFGARLRRIGKLKHKSRFEDYVGCNPHFFYKWIESNFKTGMSYENRHLWEIDHVFPSACCGTDIEEVKRAQHYRNLKPMWMSENCHKSCKITEESLVSGFICGLTKIHLKFGKQITEELCEKAKRIGFSVFDHTGGFAIV